MSLKDDWQDVNRILTKSGDAVKGDLDKNELVEYTESLVTIPKYTAGAGAAVGALMGEEVGLYSNGDLNEASGLDGWEDPYDWQIRVMATSSFSMAISGGITFYGTKKFADYVRNRHSYE